MIHTKLECVMNLTLELTFQWSKIISYDFKIIAVKLEHILKFSKLVFRAVYIFRLFYVVSESSCAYIRIQSTSLPVLLLSNTHLPTFHIYYRLLPSYYITDIFHGIHIPTHWITQLSVRSQSNSSPIMTFNKRINVITLFFSSPWQWTTFNRLTQLNILLEDHLK